MTTMHSVRAELRTLEPDMPADELELRAEYEVLMHTPAASPADGYRIRQRIRQINFLLGYGRTI